MNKSLISFLFFFRSIIKKNGDQTMDDRELYQHFTEIKDLLRQLIEALQGEEKDEGFTAEPK